MNITTRLEIILIIMFLRISLYSRKINVFKVKKLMILIEMTTLIIKSTLFANHFSVEALSFWSIWMWMYSTIMRRENSSKMMTRFNFQLNAILKALLNIMLIKTFRIKSRFWNINFCNDVDTNNNLKIMNFEKFLRWSKKFWLKYIICSIIFWWMQWIIVWLIVLQTHSMLKYSKRFAIISMKNMKA